jgi:hypothetical protein
VTCNNDKHTIVILATADLAEASVSVTAVTRAFEHLTRFSPAQYVVDSRVIRCFLRYNIWLSPELHEVFSGVVRGFLQRGGRPTCNINVRGCSESARFETLRGFLRCGEKLTWSASRLRRAAHDINRQNQHVRRFSPARCEVFSGVENSSF